MLYFRCYPGYFVNTTLLNQIQTFHCVGQLGGWVPKEGKTLIDCTAHPGQYYKSKNKIYPFASKRFLLEDH